MNNRHILFCSLAILSAICFTSCKKNDEPRPAAQFTSGIAIYYADYYRDKGVDAYVWEMEFYSGSVEATEDGYSGTGQILTFTDVFSPAPTETEPLPLGAYMVSDSHEVFTTIAGMQKDGYDLGAYLTTLVDGQTSALEYFSTGSVEIKQGTGDTLNISFDLMRHNGNIYHNDFHGILPLYTAVW